MNSRRAEPNFYPSLEILGPKLHIMRFMEIVRNKLEIKNKILKIVKMSIFCIYKMIAPA